MLIEDIQKIVYSIRNPVELRETMEELVKNKSKERLLAEAKEIRKDMKADVSAAELIRADRDAR
jgi:hypothetical protein